MAQRDCSVLAGLTAMESRARFNVRGTSGSVVALELLGAMRLLAFGSGPSLEQPLEPGGS
eukprot:11992940-Heterocapsa_arctica.AAC.1